LTIKINGFAALQVLRTAAASAWRGGSTAGLLRLVEQTGQGHVARLKEAADD
jgi:hypothetical protein